MSLCLQYILTYSRQVCIHFRSHLCKATSRNVIQRHVYTPNPRSAILTEDFFLLHCPLSFYGRDTAYLALGIDGIQKQLTAMMHWISCYVEHMDYTVKGRITSSESTCPWYGIFTTLYRHTRQQIQPYSNQTRAFLIHTSTNGMHINLGISEKYGQV